MATTKQAAPAKKSEGFQGVRGAFWIIVVCAIIAFTLFFTWFGNDMHFQDPGIPVSYTHLTLPTIQL